MTDNFLLGQEYVSVDLKHGKPGISKSEFYFLTLIISIFGYFSYGKYNLIFLTYRHSGDWRMYSLILNIKYIMHAHLVTIIVHSYITFQLFVFYSYSAEY